ncbi:hypothetical protein Tsubulata_017402 [Turnera subulata]|uniref:Uncharacterized protein n=1 Tax=Turnera subulata TaxID=218843 RepID=A0A9Q0G5F7_9ROSI|nr:hypothetical protein Tsubulata_017402 [Turnera subulata]
MPRVSTIKRRSRDNYIRPRLSCKATNDDHDSQNSATRRDVLIGLGGLYGAANFQESLAFAAPIKDPDTAKCGKADSAGSGNCCPPTAKRVLNFSPPSANDLLRVRPAAHLVDDAYIAKYSKAVELMKALPADDPRNFTQQANVHCAYCDGVSGFRTPSPQLMALLPLAQILSLLQREDPGEAYR